MADIRDLRGMVAVYEHRHFGKAAKTLGLSQSAVSKSIQRLELSFGITLFDRTRAHVTPTTACEVLVERANQVLADLADLDTTVRMLSGLEIGSLSVGVGPAMSESYVTRAIAELAEKHPGVHIDVRVDHWRQLSKWLASGRIDLLVADVADVANDDRFVVTPLPPEEFTWFCRPDHPLATRERTTREDLMMYPLATPRMPPWATRWFEEVFSMKESEASTRTLPTVRCENYSMLKRIVLASDCVSVALMDTIRTELNEGRLTAIAVEATTLTTNAGIVQVRGRTPSPLATAFVHQVEELARR